MCETELVLPIVSVDKACAIRLIVSWIVRFVITFVLISIVSAILISVFDVSFGMIPYWDRHGIWLLIGLAVLPRLTLLFSSIASGGLLWWIGWVFAPRILVAILATIAYFKTNPVLVVVAWLVAVGGESTEKYCMRWRAVGNKKKGGNIED